MGTSCVLITIAVLRVIAAFKLSRSSRLRAAIGQKKKKKKKKKIVILDYSEKGQRIHILHIRFPCSDYKKGS